MLYLEIIIVSRKVQNIFKKFWILEKKKEKNTYASKIVSDISNCIWFIVKYARLWADNKWQKDDCIVFFFHEIKRYVKFTRECFVAE